MQADPTETRSVDPATLAADCSCGERLWKVREGQWTLLTRVLRFDIATSTFEARCPTCRALVPVPFLGLTAPPVAAAARATTRRYKSTRVALPA